ncbi:MAG: BPL-N domain-containing protein [Micromonosporaceae bacterium]
MNTELLPCGDRLLAGSGQATYRGLLGMPFRSSHPVAPERYARIEHREPPLALVYRGPASSPGCPEAVATLLRASRWRFRVRYVGPGEDVPLSASVLAGAALYAQPGGGGLTHGYRHLRRHRTVIREFVRSGGRYLGFCLGGYLAGATPGFDLLPGDTDQYISTADATVSSGKDTVVHVRWRGRQRGLFFQDGPCFLVRPGPDVTVVATYPNGAVAALVAGFGSGRVGVVGPHPEATPDWFIDAGLTATDPLGADLGLDLVDTVMRR